MITLEDILIAARTVYGEAGGEPYEGKVAVAHVMRNRWLSTSGQWAKDDTLATACLRPWQFSAWNKGDPVFDRMQEAVPDSFVFRECLKAVVDALAPDAVDPTRGAHHYMTETRLKKGWPRSWGPEIEAECQIGAHLFYRGIP